MAELSEVAEGRFTTQKQGAAKYTPGRLGRTMTWLKNPDNIYYTKESTVSAKIL